ncbi:MAG: cation transporter, partial [Bacteroidetes bacterium]
QQEAARQTIALNALEGKPSIGVGLDYIAVGKRSDASPEHNGRDILGPRVSVRVPIYRDKYHAREQEERLKILALETQQQQQYLQFRSTLDQAFADYEDGRLKFQLYQEQEATLESTGQLLLTDYSTSGRRFVDLLQLEDQLLQYQLRSLSAVVQTRNARAAIERFRY